MRAATVLVLACLVLPVVHAMTRVSTGDATLDALERWEERETQSLLRRHQQKASVRQHALLNALQQRVSKEQARVESLLAVDSSVRPHVAAAKEKKAAAPAAAADAPVELEVSAAVVQPHAAAGASSGESETMRQARKELMEADSLLETLEEEVSSKATAHLPEVDATMLVPIQPKPRAKKPKQQKKAPEEAPSMVEVMERARVLEQQRAKHSAAAAEQSRSQEQKKGETLLRVDEAMAIKRLHEASRKEASIPQLKVSMAVLQPLEAPPVLMETAATEHAAVAHTTAAAATATATAGVQQKGKAQQKQTQTNAEAAVVDQFNPFDVNHLAVFSHADNVVAAHKSIVPSGEAGVEEDRRQGEGAFKQQDAMLRLFHQLSPHPAGDRSIPELLETSSTVLAHHESAVHAAALKAPVHDPEQAYQFLKSTSTDSVALPPTLRSEDQDDADPTFQAAAQFLDAVANRDHLDPALL